MGGKVRDIFQTSREKRRVENVTGKTSYEYLNSQEFQKNQQNRIKKQKSRGGKSYRSKHKDPSKAGEGYAVASPRGSAA